MCHFLARDLVFIVRLLTWESASLVFVTFKVNSLMEVAVEVTPGLCALHLMRAFAGAPTFDGALDNTFELFLWHLFFLDTSGITSEKPCRLFISVTALFLVGIRVS